MTDRQQPQRCRGCNVKWKQCGLKSENCFKTFPVSDAELEFILQTNEQLPTDEQELPVRDLIVMNIRERASCASHSSATEPEDDTREAVAKALLHQRKRLFHKLTTGKCVPNGDCADCILCDNAGGCHAEGSYQVQKEAQTAREEVLESLDELRKYANSEYEESNLSDNEREMRIHLEYTNRIWGIMRSLRSGGK